MDDLDRKKNNRQIGLWLLTGVGMIVIQVVLGGITRLTESGLSITEWKPITGILPPLNGAAWQIQFEKYRTTDQFKYVHGSFTLHDFKFIFFWEWAHRLWARLMGFVFLIGFTYFLIRKKFSRGMILPLGILFLLGALQGVIGWLMVKSGLVPEKYFVGHIELTTHFIAALLLLCYTLWCALNLVIDDKRKIHNPVLKKTIAFIFILLFFQLIYGGFMAGLHAGVTAPTWPDINGKFIPATFNELKPWTKNLIDNKLTVQFIHRGLAYLLFILITIFYFRSANVRGPFFRKLKSALLFLIILQVLLGIFTVINTTQYRFFVWLGVLHQFTAMLVVICLVCMMHTLSNSKRFTIRP